MVFRFVLVAVLLSVLSGCGGDDEAFGFRPRAGNTGSINLYVTDAPIDYATEVVLTFTGVVLERAEGDPVHLRVHAPSICCHCNGAIAPNCSMMSPCPLESMKACACWCLPTFRLPTPT